MERNFVAVKDIEFDYGHRVPDHKSKCYNIHGHRAKLEVYVKGPLSRHGSSTGMVMDFADIKFALTKVSDLFDHTMIVSVHDEGLKKIISTGKTTGQIRRNDLGLRYTVEHFGVVQEINCTPTAENLAFICYDILQGLIFSEFVSVSGVVFWETPHSRAQYFVRPTVLQENDIAGPR